MQGINDLATPFYQVFLSSYIGKLATMFPLTLHQLILIADCDPEDYDISALPPEALLALEADTFWCLSKLLDGIQDNYIFAQPGIHRQVARCQELCARVDGQSLASLLCIAKATVDVPVSPAPLAKHLESEGVSFLQFSFRWFHLLFLRVLPVNSVIRMWDTYMVCFRSSIKLQYARPDGGRYSLKDRTHSQTFIPMSAWHSCFDGARSCGRWISKLLCSSCKSQ